MRSCGSELHPILPNNKLVCRNAVTGLVSELDVSNDSLQVYRLLVTLKLIGHCQGCDVTSPSFGLNPELV